MNINPQICWKLYDVDISDEAIDLLKRMLNPDPAKRISAEQIKNHRWFKSFAVET